MCRYLIPESHLVTIIDINETMHFHNRAPTFNRLIKDCFIEFMKETIPPNTVEVEVEKIVIRHPNIEVVNEAISLLESTKQKLSNLIDPKPIGE